MIALDAKGFFIGISKDTDYEEKALSIEPGDKLLLYTDGITEIRNAEGDEFGEQRLGKFIINNSHHSGEKFCDLLLETIKSFAPLEHRVDDIAFLSINF